MTSAEKALRSLALLPRISPHNIRDLPRSVPPPYDGLKRKKRGLGHRGCSQFQNFPPLGFVGRKMPFYLSVPKERSKRNHVRISLLQLQRMIDLNRVDPLEPIDLSSLCCTNLFTFNTDVDRHCGIHLTSEGAEKYLTPVNIEVQYADEEVIAAIERVGGVITTRFYDLYSVWAKSDPKTFFNQGIPIPRAKLPPKDCVPYYSNPESRGYLADPEAVATARIWLSQKYGYAVPDLSNLSDSMLELMSKRKDPRQIFYGLHPGWLVNIPDKVVLKPKSPILDSFYQS